MCVCVCVRVCVCVCVCVVCVCVVRVCGACVWCVYGVSVMCAVVPVGLRMKGFG